MFTLSPIGRFYYCPNLFSSKNSTIPFIAHTTPAVKTPSKKIDGNHPILNSCDVSPPIVIEKKNPTHVDVHNIHFISSEINLPIPWYGYIGFSPHRCIKFLKPSKIEPYTIMVLIPYAANAQNIIFSIILNYTKKNPLNKIIHHIMMTCYYLSSFYPYGQNFQVMM